MGSAWLRGQGWVDVGRSLSRSMFFEGGRSRALSQSDKALMQSMVASSM